MQFNAIVDRVESLKAFQAMQLAFYERAEIFPDHPIGHQGATLTETVLWTPELDVWAALRLSAREGNRFWNAFGTRKPATGALPITVEINPPHEGANARTAGLFVRDQNGQTYVAHSGKIGGGRRGIGATSFRETVTRGAWRDIKIGDGTRTALVFGPLGGTEFLKQVSEFVHKVEEFKGNREMVCAYSPKVRAEIE